MKFRLAAIVAVTLMLPLSLAAQTGATARLEVPYRLFTLPNGLTVIMHQDRSVPIVATNIWYHVGSANERPGRTGFAHLFEHLMFEGSKDVPEGEFDRLLESAGATNNGSTTNDRTNYFIDMPSNNISWVIGLIQGLIAVGFFMAGKASMSKNAS